MSSVSVSDCATVMLLLWLIVFPVLQGDGFDEAKCEIPSSVGPLHASAYRSYPPAHSCFSCVACDILALKTAVKPGAECPWCLPNWLCSTEGECLPGTASPPPQEWPFTTVQT